jgi:hypothetical protein
LDSALHAKPVPQFGGEGKGFVKIHQNPHPLFFDAEGGDPQKTPARKVRLVFGREKAEVDVASAHLPSRRGRASVTSLKNPVLHPNAWASLLFYAQSKDDRGLEVTPIEPPKLVLEGKAYDYPAWPEPGLVWRVRVGAL